MVEKQSDGSDKSMSAERKRMIKKRALAGKENLECGEKFGSVSEAALGKVVCVTGPMASGKNYICAILESVSGQTLPAASSVAARASVSAARNVLSESRPSLPFVSIDADKVVHEVLKSESVKAKILATFGKAADEKGINLLNEDGSLNRRNLGELIFADKRLLSCQEAIVHPEVGKSIERFIGAHKNENVLINATVLYKTEAMKLCDAVLYVTAPIATRFLRAKKRDGLKSAQIIARFWSQRKLFAKYKKATADIYKVNNTGNKKKLEIQLKRFLKSCR